MLDAASGARDVHSDEVDHELASRILDGKEDLAHTGHLHVELFAELPAHGFQVGLPGLDLAPGKLPQAAMPLVGGALGQKEPSAIRDDSSEDASRHSGGGVGAGGQVRDPDLVLRAPHRIPPAYYRGRTSRTNPAPTLERASVGVVGVLSAFRGFVDAAGEG